MSGNKKNNSEFVGIQDLVDLASTRGPITPIHVKKLNDIVLHSKYSKKKVLEFFDRPEFDRLSLLEKADALSVCDKYNTDHSDMACMIKANYSVSQAAEMMEFSELYHANLLSSNRDSSNKLSYNMLVFVDQISGNHHNAQEVDLILTSIEDIISESDSEIGLGTVLNKMQRVYTKHSGINPETAARLVINSCVPSVLRYDTDDDTKTDDTLASSFGGYSIRE